MCWLLKTDIFHEMITYTKLFIFVSLREGIRFDLRNPVSSLFFYFLYLDPRGRQTTRTTISNWLPWVVNHGYTQTEFKHLVNSTVDINIRSDRHSLVFVLTLFSREQSLSFVSFYIKTLEKIVFFYYTSHRYTNTSPLLHVHIKLLLPFSVSKSFNMW